MTATRGRAPRDGLALARRRDAAVLERGAVSPGVLDLRRVVERLGQLGHRFTGIINSGSSSTASGVKVIEFNARFGNPECMNIISLFKGDWPYVMGQLAADTLSPGDVELRKEASRAVSLSPDYALRAGEPMSSNSTASTRSARRE